MPLASPFSTFISPIPIQQHTAKGQVGFVFSLFVSLQSR